NGGTKNLVVNYLSFVYYGILYSFKFKRKKKFDSILVYAPSPITSALPAIFLKYLLKRVPVTVWVQDLWPESLIATGFVKNRFMLKIVEMMVKGIYYFSDTILVQSLAFIPKVSLMIKDKNKIFYYPNSALDMRNRNIESDHLPIELIKILENNFCIVFAGNLGTAQAVETILGAAVLLQTLTDFKIVLVGSGSMSEWLANEVRNKMISNVILAGRFPPSDMPSIYSKSKGLLVTLKKSEIFNYTIPCKVQSYLSAGLPIIAAIDGEGARIIIESGAGLATAAEDPHALAESIKRLYYMTDLQREKMGSQGRAYFLKNYEISIQAQRLIKILKKQANKMDKTK
ncbi:MAG: glycosyltransferase WbuB, partial [Legionella sp.]